MQLKEKRDAAILEKHKEGMSNKAISKMFGVHMNTIADVIAGGTKILNQEICTPEVSTSTVPMASTEDRSETREDARS
ncbi:helix-turn-helix domain-containing protein [Aeromonas veronii]|uniref:helix-turn-helix domain-containing protein n=1 Tax=Aeromonas veronii TaxID=654 RepID=UPI0022453104|nr:helix-turn-helix domain-containing protein [Aeromonas veronii]MCX0436148.1 helix-turn-helix domain-containing protein [Aeromonas veronii]